MNSPVETNTVDIIATQSNAPDPAATSHWADDVIDRKQYADFLTKSVIKAERLEWEDGQPGLTIALDAPWGAGKSFFIRRWMQDLSDAGHPVVLFDAWRNDLGEEAVIPLMAAVKEELDRWCKEMPVDSRLRKDLEERVRSTVGGLRKAVMPAAKVLATGLVKKLTGVAVDELIDAVSDSADDVSHSSKPNEGTTEQLIGKGAAEALDKSLDELFDKALEEHSARLGAVEKFKKEFQELLATIKEGAGAQLPMVVFVDEVDRCRPSYAITLLEEIKHLFGCNDLCFVVSTNLAQLKESTRAVYGAGFDSYAYLKRFFDLECTLPIPDRRRFTEILIQRFKTMTERTIVPSSPAFQKNSPAEMLRDSLLSISTAFDLDLRSHRQIVQMASASARNLAPSTKIHALWLYFLCALRHQDPEAFAIFDSKMLGNTEFHTQISKSVPNEVHVPWPYDHRTGGATTVPLREILWSYFRTSKMMLLDIEHELENSNANIYEFPYFYIQELAAELPPSRISLVEYWPSTRSYFSSVRYAGHLLS